MEKKQILALMSAVIYGQSKTLRVPECVKIAEEFFDEAERLYPAYSVDTSESLLKRLNMLEDLIRHEPQEAEVFETIEMLRGYLKDRQ